MGAALYIVLNQKVNFNTSVNGKAVARAEEVLDIIATRLGVKPLMDFYSVDPNSVPAEIGDRVAHWREEWFEASAGLETMRVLISHLETNDIKGVNTGAVLIDLMQFEQVLRQAAVQGVQWHLEVDY